MDLGLYVQALREDLTRVAAVGEESTTHAAELLVVALGPSFGQRFQEALSEAALELSAQLENGRVELRVSGGGPELVYVDEAAPSRHELGDEAFSARITLRLPESLKSRLEQAATADGISVNTWLVQALGRVLEPRRFAGGSRRRLTGYGRT